MYCAIYVSVNLIFSLYQRNFMLPIFFIVNLSVNTHVDWTLYPLQTLLFSFSDDLPFWVTILVLILSNDIELNPGDYLNKGFLSFCTWNLNTVSKDNFQRVSLLQVHNTLRNYDIISLCETSLNDTIELPEELLPNYKFSLCTSPSGKKHGGVGLFFKAELIFGHKHVFFFAMHRNPINKSIQHGIQSTSQYSTESNQ